MAAEESAYRQFLETIQVADIFVRKLSYESGNGLAGVPINLAIDIKRSVSTRREGNRFIVMPVFTVRVSSGRKKVMLFVGEYELAFDVLKEKEFEKHIEDEEILGFFQGYQTDKFVWSFLRCDFHHACASIGLRPIALPMLK
jgi:hypothetical protein